MVSASEIKARIHGVNDTKKITDAMYMIASAKLRKALRNYERTKPYFDTLKLKISELFYDISNIQSRYFRTHRKSEGGDRTRGLILITSDKGLAASYNHTAIQTCVSYMQRHPQTKLFVIGEFGRQYFLRKNIPFEESFHYSPEHISVSDARKICAELLELYNNGVLDEIDIIYTDYRGARVGECKKICLLPLDHATFTGDFADKPHIEKEFFPSSQVVFDHIIPSYLTGFIYSSLVDSFCSEQQARMGAMKSASDNAEEMLKALKLQYNEVRQAAITNEMIEIAAGAKALRERRRG